MIQEEWKDIPNLKGYQASNLGNVRSLNYNKTGKTKNLSQYNICGYLAVKATKNGISRRYLVHRLIISAFKGENEKEVNHIDGNKHNNNIENLEYCTRSENVLHAYKNGFKKAPSGANHIKSKPVLQLKNEKIIKKYSYLSEVNKYGFLHSEVCLCCQGKRKTHKGFEWKYAKVDDVE